MSAALRFGLLLGVLVVLWTFVMGITGWSVDPVLLNLFWIVVLLQIGVLIAAFRSPGMPLPRYGDRVLFGSLVSIYGGVVIFFGSILMTAVIFPNYFHDLRAAHLILMRGQGMAEGEIAAALAAEAATQTSFWQACFGFLGTVITGVVTSLILGAVIAPTVRPDARDPRPVDDRP